MSAITGNLNCVTCVMVMVIRCIPGNRVIAAVNATTLDKCFQNMAVAVAGVHDVKFGPDLLTFKHQSPR